MHVFLRVDDGRNVSHDIRTRPTSAPTGLDPLSAPSGALFFGGTFGPTGSLVMGLLFDLFDCSDSMVPTVALALGCL
jgi:hypothetical protein